MFCVNCGNTIKEEGELICKGCSKLDASLRDEILAFSEKSSERAAELKCPKCGGAHGAGVSLLQYLRFTVIKITPADH